MKIMKIIMNDRMFEDGWAEAYHVTLYFAIDISKKIVVEGIQKCANFLAEKCEMEWSEDGINKILRTYQNSEKTLVKWKIEFVPTVCFGNTEFLLH